MSKLHASFAIALTLALIAPLSAHSATPSSERTATVVAPGVQRAVCDAAVITGKVRYVSLAGNDATADGSLARPYRTLSRVAELVQANESIVVRGGTYLEPNPVEIRVPGVTIRSFPGEWAVVDRGNAALSEDSGIDFYVGADDGVLTCIEVIGGFYTVAAETKWDWGDPADRAGVSRLRIENTRLHGAYADVIKIKPNCDDILIHHNEIFNSGVGQNPDECNAEGIDNVNGDRAHIAYNHIHDICSTGVYLKGGATDGIVEYNLIERTGGAGILLGFDTSPEYFDLAVNPKYYENIRGIARYNLIREVGWAGIGFYASKDAQAYNNTILDAANTYHSPLYFGLSYQDWDETAGRPPNINPSFSRNVISQSPAVTRDPSLVSIRYSIDLGGMSALTGNPTLSDNCYDRQGGAARFLDQRTNGGEDWVGNLAAWQKRISGDAGSYDVDVQLDANFQTQNPQCKGRGHQWAAQTYQIEISASPAQGGTVSGGGAYPAEGTATLKATPNAGWTFANWTHNAKIVSTQAQYTFAVKANRKLVATFTRQSAVDLLVTGITLTPVSPGAKGIFTAKISIKNTGATSANGGNLLVWANQPAAQTCGATASKSVAVGTLAAGASKTLTVNGLAAGAVGNKTLRAFVDGDCTTTESNERNNQLTKAYQVINRPDFVVTDIQLTPTSPRLNSRFNVAVTVKNQGTLEGNGGYLDLWSNRSTAQSCRAMGESWATIGRLQAGQSKTVTLALRADRVVGAKTLRAFVDSWCQTTESTEGNNQLGKTYQVQ